MSPPNSPLLAQEQWTISLNMAIIIDEIWKTRNLMLFQEGKANPVKARQNDQEKFLEINFFFFKKVFSPAIQPLPVQITATQTPPQDGVKINVDATLNSSGSALAVVTRDHHGEVIYIQVKDIKFVPLRKLKLKPSCGQCTQLSKNDGALSSLKEMQNFSLMP